MLFFHIVYAIIYPGEHEHIMADVSHKDHPIYEIRRLCNGYENPEELDSDLRNGDIYSNNY
jgi:hypothetical protein